MKTRTAGTAQIKRIKTVVLGGGMVGNAIARDLIRDSELEVTVVDRSRRVLDGLADEPRIATRQADLSRADTVKEVVAHHDLVVGAVPGAIGFNTVKACLEAGKDTVDISFFPEDALELDGLARRRGARCLVDFGVAPGCSNLIFGHASATFRRVDSFSCFVGGLPVERTWPWEYKAPFSPGDVFDEYIRPARYIAGGEVVTKPALSDPELIHFDGVGTLEGFLTDGLRTLLCAEGAGGVQYMVEKTCRYPGYRDKVAVLRDSGFLAAEPVSLGDGTSVRPRDVTSRLLFDAWRLGAADEDVTAMRVEVAGVDGAGAEVTRTWDLVDRYDRATRTSSMARTTGYSCTAGVRLLARGLYDEVGVSPPERVGRRAACFDFVMRELERRGVVFSVR